MIRIHRMKMYSNLQLIKIEYCNYFMIDITYSCKYRT